MYSVFNMLPHNKQMEYWFKNYHDLPTVNISVLLGSERLTRFVDKRAATRREYNALCHDPPQEDIKVPESRLTWCVSILLELIAWRERKVVRAQGHKFDSSLINQLTDLPLSYSSALYTFFDSGETWERIVELIVQARKASREARFSFSRLTPPMVLCVNLKPSHVSLDEE